MLVFERYAEREEDVPAIKTFLETAMNEIHGAIGPYVELKMVTANDISDFREHPLYLVVLRQSHP